MPTKIILKNSTVKDKAPQPSDLDVGELAVNLNKDSPAIYGKDSAGAIVKLAGEGSIGDEWTRDDGTATISPRTTGDNVSTTGTVTGASLIPTGATVPSNGAFLPAANTVGIATSGAERLRIESAGRVIKGHTTSVDTVLPLTNVAVNPGCQQHGLKTADSTLALYNWANNAAHAALTFNKARGASIGTHGITAVNEDLGFINFAGSDGATFHSAAWISGRVDAAPVAGSNSVPGRLTFATTSAGSNSPVERMRIRSDGNIGIGYTGSASATIDNRKPLTGGTDAYSSLIVTTIQDDVTNNAYIYRSQFGTAAASFTLANAYHFHTVQAALGAGSAITNQFGYWAGNMVGAANNYGFYGAVPSGTGRWNFYAGGTAPNYFTGDVRSGTVVTTRQASVQVDASTILTASSLLDGLRVGAPVAAITYTIPTGTNMDAVFQDLQNNQSFEWSVINLSGANTITVDPNTDHTVQGNMVVAASSSGRFLTRKINANSFTTYRIA